MWLETFGNELIFFDIKVFNPLARTYMNQSFKSAFKTNEKNKKRNYNSRISRIEKGSFTLVVLSSLGGMGLESCRFLSRLIELGLYQTMSKQRFCLNSFVRKFLVFVGHDL